MEQTRLPNHIPVKLTEVERYDIICGLELLIIQENTLSQDLEPLETLRKKIINTPSITIEKPLTKRQQLIIEATFEAMNNFLDKEHINFMHGVKKLCDIDQPTKWEKFFNLINKSWKK